MTHPHHCGESAVLRWVGYSDSLRGWMVYSQAANAVYAHENAGPFRRREDAERLLGPPAPVVQVIADERKGDAC